MEQEGGEVRSEVVCGGGLAQRNPGQEDPVNTQQGGTGGSKTHFGE